MSHLDAEPVRPPGLSVQGSGHREEAVLAGPHYTAWPYLNRRSEREFFASPLATQEINVPAASQQASLFASPSRFAIRFPEVSDDLDQNEDWFEFGLVGRSRKLRIHDYAASGRATARQFGRRQLP